MKKYIRIICFLFIFILNGCVTRTGPLAYINKNLVSHVEVGYQSAKVDITDPNIMNDLQRVIVDIHGKETGNADIRDTDFSVKLFRDDGSFTVVSIGMTSDDRRICRVDNRGYSLDEAAYSQATGGIMKQLRAWCTQLVPARDVPLAGDGILALEKGEIVFSGEAIDSIKRIKVLDCPPNKVLDLDEQTQSDVISSLRTLSFSKGTRLPYEFVLKPSPLYRIDLYRDGQDDKAVFTINYYEEESGFLYAVLAPGQLLAVLASEAGMPPLQ